MHGGFPPEEPLSAMEQMLLLGSALFCALLWRCLARSMNRRAREREERRRRKILPSIGSQGEFLNPRTVALGGRPVHVSQRSRSAPDQNSTSGGDLMAPSMFVLKRCSSDPQGAAVNIPIKRVVSEDGQRSRKSANTFRGSIPLSAQRKGLQLMFDRLDTLERRRGNGRSRDYTPGSPGGSPRRATS